MSEGKSQNLNSTADPGQDWTVHTHTNIHTDTRTYLCWTGVKARVLYIFLFDFFTYMVAKYTTKANIGSDIGYVYLRSCQAELYQVWMRSMEFFYFILFFKIFLFIFSSYWKASSVLMADAKFSAILLARWYINEPKVCVVFLVSVTQGVLHVGKILKGGNHYFPFNSNQMIWTHLEDNVVPTIEPRLEK